MALVEQLRDDGCMASLLPYGTDIGDYAFI